MIKYQVALENFQLEQLLFRTLCSMITLSFLQQEDSKAGEVGWDSKIIHLGGPRQIGHTTTLARVITDSAHGEQKILVVFPYEDQRKRFLKIFPEVKKPSCDFRSIYDVAQGNAAGSQYNLIFIDNTRNVILSSKHFLDQSGYTIDKYLMGLMDQTQPHCIVKLQ